MSATTIIWIVATVIGGGGLGAVVLSLWRWRRAEGIEAGKAEAGKAQAEQDSRRKDDVATTLQRQRDGVPHSLDAADRVWDDLRADARKNPPTG